MITPIGTMTINQIMERKDDLLMSDDDIKEMARNVRKKAIDDFLEEMEKWNSQIKFMRNKSAFFTIENVREVAEQLKGVRNE